jgi:hypothetical protein
VSLLVNSKTVEIRLTIFRARTLTIVTQIYYYTLADFSSARSRIDGLHITPPSLVTGERRRSIMARAAKEAGHGEGPEPERSGTSRGEA